MSATPDPRSPGDSGSSLERSESELEESTDTSVEPPAEGERASTVADPRDVGGRPEAEGDAHAGEHPEQGAAAGEPATGEFEAPADGEGSTLERGSEDPRDQDEIFVNRARVRRAPRLARFAGLGVVLGLLVAVAQALMASPDDIAAVNGPWVGGMWGFWLLMCSIFVPIGALLGCAVALLADRRSRRRDRDPAN